MKKPKGMDIIRAHQFYTGDDCIAWPMSRNNFGYGQVCDDGKVKRAHRVMCELVNGPPPTPDHYATHSCGNGHLGCFNPMHLAWKTASENQYEAVRHGRAKKPGFPRKTIPDEQVRQIRRLRATKSLSEIKAALGIKTETIRKILKGEIRSRVQQRI
jgi:hypothetical protein